MSNLTNISPVDGRYASKTSKLKDYFSEYALIKYRVIVELKYFTALTRLPITTLSNFTTNHLNTIEKWIEEFSEKDAAEIKEIEKITNHDVKAVEYWIKKQFDNQQWDNWKEYIHFGLTSQDINNTSIPMMIQDAINKVYVPQLNDIIVQLVNKAGDWENIPMLAKTHGQPASPTKLGKEFQVFLYRLKTQLSTLQNIPISGKFGGATGNFNAHKIAFPEINWPEFANGFLQNDLKIERQQWTTQIENYDNMAALFQGISRINTILIDLCRDIWQYISQDYFKQKIVAGEVGSSAMPHKVNPIDFENAEGNLGIANALFNFLAEKLPISRLQRDLTDSTVTRNIGVPFAHSMIALLSLKKGLSKIILNQGALEKDLNDNWAVVAEAIQNILRRENYPNPYETLKELTRTGNKITEETIQSFVDNLKISETVKKEIKSITPFNYTGY
ncbi:adenylosuccinate lyase [Membranihabitans maritimus]|uniref:adenylosuccinate lyase n=1 Tax=Membranihabitans maritimus TaxID=2904244 RepID=UPI001F00C7E2|nr:adenylosuccinate lyase [Membranihabitans maritimus]